MTVQELIDRLEQEDLGAVVRMAYQPSWPLQSSIRGVIGSEELQADEDEGPDSDPADGVSAYTGSAAEVVWIVEGSQNRDGSPYAPRDVFEGAWT